MCETVRRQREGGREGGRESVVSNLIFYAQREGGGERERERDLHRNTIKYTSII